MTTLAKSKAQALVQPAKPLAVTPNVRQFNSPAAGATLSLSNESTNIVQVVNPASTLSINVDSQNFSAFGANHFVLHVDTTAATEISLNFVRGATILATKVIEIDADQIAILTFAAITKANDAVTLLAIGHHVVGKSEATDGNGAVGGLLLVPTGAMESADGEFQRFAYDGTNTIDFEAQGSTYQLPIWYADLPLANRQSEYQISLKMPDLPDGKSAYLMIGDMPAAALFDNSGLNLILLALAGGGLPTGIPHANLILKIANDQAGSASLLMLPSPTVGSIITLTLTTTALDYSWDGGSDSMTLPVGFFAAAPNLLAYSASEAALDVMPLSIKVAGA